VSRLVRRTAGYVGAVVFMLLVWALLAAAVDSPALPGPVPTLADFIRLFPSELWPNMLVSGARVLAALLISLVAVPVGLLVGRAPRVDAVVAPVVYLTYPIPKVVFLPVLLVLLGIGDASKVSLIALILFFQILVTARDAAKSIPPDSVMSVRSLGAGRWDVFRHVVFPAALPEVFTALRISVGTAIAVLFFSETVAGTSGLGWYILDAWSRLDYPAMYAGIVAMGLLGVIFYEVLEAIERRVSRWRRAGAGASPAGAASGF
jgi:ABC-type nitrate/sulfonate/bicarbonate transport system permease component